MASYQPYQRHCCIPGCGKSYKDDTVLHLFPNPDKDMDRYLEWTRAAGASISSLDPQYVYRNRRVCHTHFLPKYLTWTKRLSCDAVPTLFMRVFAPRTSRSTRSTIDMIQTPNSSGVDNPDICNDDSNADDDSGTLVESNVVNPEICDDDANADDDSDTLVESNVNNPDIFDDDADAHDESYTLVESNVDNPDICDDDANADDDSDTLVESNIDNPDIFDDDADADDDSDSLVESNVCRVCLALDVKMYDLKDIELREMFQNVTGIVITENNHSILEGLCWECTGKLKAAAAFRNKALLSDALLQGLASSGEKIRKNDITLIKVTDDYLKSFGSLSVTEVYHTVDIDPENDSVPPISKNNETEIVQNTVRNDSIKLKKIDEDNYQIVINVEDESMIEAPITTEMEYEQFDQICLNTGVESSNIFLETNPVITKNVSFREDKIKSVNSSPLPSCSHVEPKYANLGYLLTTPSDSEDKTKEPITKITNRDSNSKIVFINSKELINAKFKNKYLKKCGISKKTSNLKLLKKSRVKANTPTDEECRRLEDFDC